MIGKISITEEKFPAQGETLIYIAFEGEYQKNSCFKILDKLSNKKLSQKLQLHDFTGKEGEIVSIDIDNSYKTIIVIGAGKEKDFNSVQWKNTLSHAFRYAQRNKLLNVTVSYFDKLGKNYFEIGKNLALALYLTNYHFDFYKGEESKKKIKRINQLNLQLTTDNEQLTKGIEFGKLLAEGIYLARDLVNQPASHTHPETLVEQTFQIEKESKGKIKVEILDEDECRRLGMGAFLGVAQGSEKKPKFIVLHYTGNRHSGEETKSTTPESIKRDSGQARMTKCICLIGKSITFDSGGLSLKPSEFMETMKMDMAGGATVLGVFKILAKINNVVTGRDLSLPEIYGILPACENMPSGKALRPGDVLKVLNNKTIEVLNTDAEGRLTLADALSYAEKHIKPDMIIDLATLTGACMVALGKDIAGMFSNDQKMQDNFEKVAIAEGEELWPLPLHKHYAKSLKSRVADLKNVGGGRYGGAITAALFLSEFVNKAKWIHIDIAGPAYNEDNIYGATSHGGTGWGVLTLMAFLQNLQ